jgi:hypothetical protein
MDSSCSEVFSFASRISYLSHKLLYILPDFFSCSPLPSCLVPELNESGNIVDYPLALPSLSGVHSGERIGEIVQEMVDSFGIPRNKVSYLDQTAI